MIILGYLTSISMRMISPPILVTVVRDGRTDARGQTSPVLIHAPTHYKGYGWHKYEDVSSPMAESLSQSEEDYTRVV